MGRKSASAMGPGCSHARLQPFATAFAGAWQGTDPVADARSLGLAARSWNPAKRRRAIAARIALLSQRGSAGTAGELPAEALPPLPVPEDANGGLTTDVAPEAPHGTGRSSRRSPPPATMGAASAAGLLAEMAASDRVPGLSDNADQREDSRRLDLRNTGPLDRAGRGGDKDATTWTQDPATAKSGETGAQLESRMRDIDDSQGPVAKKITMTDLSLAILTGEFGGQDGRDAGDPAALVEEETADPAPAPEAVTETSPDPEDTPAEGQRT